MPRRSRYLDELTHLLVDLTKIADGTLCLRQSKGDRGAQGRGACDQSQACAAVDGCLKTEGPRVLGNARGASL